MREVIISRELAVELYQTIDKLLQSQRNKRDNIERIAYWTYGADLQETSEKFRQEVKEEERIRGWQEDSPFTQLREAIAKSDKK